MSDDQNYQDQDYHPNPTTSNNNNGTKQPSQQQPQSYRTFETVELNKDIHRILIESQKKQPNFPRSLSKKFCESYGLESSDETFYNLFSNIVECQLQNLLSNNREIKGTSKYYKKEGKDTQIKTIELQRLLQVEGHAGLLKPRCIPQIALPTDQSPNNEAETLAVNPAANNKMDIEQQLK